MSLPDLSGVPLTQQERLLKGPALEAPPGITSNFQNPPNGSTGSRAFLIFCIVLSSLLAITRYYGTWSSSRRFFLSDVMFTIAIGVYMAYMGVVLESIHQVGYLMHQWDIILEDMIYMNYTFAIGPILFALTTLFTKVAILLEWLRIFNPTNRHNYFFWLTYTMLTVTVIYYSLATFFLSLACRPFEKTYNPFVPGRCLETYPLYVASAVINMVLDIGILVLPQQVIWRLQMSTRRKLGVAVVFTFGLLAIICAIYRVPVTIKWINSTDFLYEFSVIGLWISAEMTCGFLVFCIPSIPKAFMGLGLSKFFSTLKSMASSGRDKSEQSSRNGPRARIGQPSDSNDYRKLHGDPVSLQTIGGSSNSKSRAFAKKPRHHLDSSIFRTTQLTTTSTEDLNNHLAEDHFKRQHPWAGDT